jgi:hypothetical protein
MIIILWILPAHQAHPVMPGLDPGIHQSPKKMDCRDKPGNDELSR